MKDMFGNELSIEDARAILRGGKRKRKPTEPKGYAAPIGSGPKGETCKTCKHIRRRQLAKTYLKCNLAQAKWTGGPGSDIRASWPARSLWEPRT